MYNYRVFKAGALVFKDDGSGASAGRTRLVFNRLWAMEGN
jgi:hypothetical protein